MKRFDRITTVLLSIAALWSAALVVLTFVIHIPVRAGSHNLVRSTSGSYVEVKVLPRTNFQAYGFSDLLLLGLGLILVIAVARALQRQKTLGQPGAGGLAWVLSIGSLVVGIVGFVTIAPSMLLVGVLLVLACRNFSKQQTDRARFGQLASSVTPRASSPADRDV
jgi:amino acid transporter